MLRRTAVGIYPNAGPHTITLKVTNLPTTGNIDVKVFGIEMVFIPQGAFYINDIYWGFTLQQITSEAAVNVYTTNYCVTGGSSWSSYGTLNLSATYPKGYAPFYLMKYEITQGQYADFLNTINAAAQTNRYLGNYNNYRNRTSNTGTPPNIFQTDRPDRAQNYLSWRDLSAYLDWAALRPMSELEYVKACRGEGPVIPGEFPWGSTTIIEENNITTPENGTETGVTPNSNANYSGSTTWITGGDGGQGPYRVGMFALPTASRVTAGAGYYGNMELAGNVSEIVVMCSNNGSAEFQRVWGDGMLSASGDHDVTGWPAATISGNNNRITTAGGSFDSGWERLRVCDRYAGHYASYYGDVYGRSYWIGGRGAR
jgi:formylglycine-generating enzyme required for sulfatase activity